MHQCTHIRTFSKYFLTFQSAFGADEVLEKPEAPASFSSRVSRRPWNGRFKARWTLKNLQSNDPPAVTCTKEQEKLVNDG